MFSKSLSDDAVPAQVREFLALFADDCADLRFPDVDLDTYVQLADAVCARQHAVDEARGELERRREALKADLAALRARAKQGLAYLRVFAGSSRPELGAKLDTLALGRPPEPAKPRRRRRSSKPPADAAAAAPNKAAPAPSGPIPAASVAELPLSGGAPARVRGAA
ncbi:MAG: hypothetical protein CSA66_03800 [Proteobacteria bacterium]|nr:MAG: hypothetical protein CSA66_03800 [Pseudomonadota bacterium]